MVRKYRFSRKPRFRRKRNNGVWFPVNGDVWTAEGASWYDATANAYVPNVPLRRADGPVNIVFPVTEDYSQQAKDAGSPATSPSLRDFVEGQDYLLKALVGNCFIEATPNPDTNVRYEEFNTWRYVQVGAGFFVARAADDDQSLPDLTQNEIDPLNGGNIQNPWIWRRTWILANQGALLGAGAQLVDVIGGTTNIYTEPRNTISATWQYPQGSDANFHTKSRRRIRREERLWFTVSAAGWDGNRTDVGGLADRQPGYKFSLDLRIFAKMVKGRNASTF